MTVVIQREDNDPIALRISIGGTPKIGYYFTYRGEPEQILPMLEIVHKEATAALSPQPKLKPAASTAAPKVEPSGDDTLTEILHGAFVGLYTRTSDGGFAAIDDKYNVLHDHLKVELLQYIEGEKAKELEAFWMEIPTHDDVVDAAEAYTIFTRRMTTLLEAAEQRQRLRGSE